MRGRETYWLQQGSARGKANDATKTFAEHGELIVGDSDEDRTPQGRAGEDR
jgi:hypothetical protein